MLDVHLNWLNRFHFLILEESLLFVLIDCMIFLLQFQDVIRVSMSIVSLLAKLNSTILWIAECYPLTYDLNIFSPFVPIRTWVSLTFKSLRSRHFYMVVFVLVAYIYFLVSNFQLIFLWTIFSNICSSSCPGGHMIPITSLY